MSYKIKNNRLKSEYSDISFVKNSEHLKITIKFNDKNYYKLNVTAQTSVHDRLEKWQEKCVLVHCYKLLERFKTNASGLRNELKHLNYAAIFGSPWN